MEIKLRKQAKNEGLTKYYTGKSCKNGHIAERYVISGACENCIRELNSKPILSPELRSERNERLQQRLELEKMKLENAAERSRIAAARIHLSTERQAKKEREREISMKLVRFRMGSPYDTIQSLRNYAFVLASVREPEIRYEDVALPKLTPGSMGAGLGLFVLACFPEDRAALIEFNNQLLSPNVVLSDEDREKHLKKPGDPIDITRPDGPKVPEL